jgi:hypothetical protein
MALGLFIRTASRHGRMVLLSATPFYASSFLFTYYANETRSYSLLLLFATLLATAYPLNGRAPGKIFHISCLLLALTHYFGLILAGVAIIASLAQRLRHRAQAQSLILLGITCLIWPVYHVFFGSLLASTGGNFWIKVGGVFGTLDIATTGLMPRFTGRYLLLLAAATVAVGLAWRHSRHLPAAEAGRESSIPSLVLQFAGVTAGFLMIVATIDLWSPMSTTRNYIVLLPFLSFLIGGASSLLSTTLPALRPIILITIFGLSLDSVRTSHRGLAEKAAAKQNWKGASELMLAESNGRHLYYVPPGNKASPWIESIANHYLLHFSGGRLRAQEYRLGETIPERPALILFGQNQGEKDLLFAEMERLGGRQIFPGYDAAHPAGPGASAGLFLIP